MTEDFQNIIVSPVSKEDRLKPFTFAVNRILKGIEEDYEKSKDYGDPHIVYGIYDHYEFIARAIFHHMPVDDLIEKFDDHSISNCTFDEFKEMAKNE